MVLLVGSGRHAFASSKLSRRAYLRGVCQQYGVSGATPYCTYYTTMLIAHCLVIARPELFLSSTQFNSHPQPWGLGSSPGSLGIGLPPSRAQASHPAIVENSAATLLVPMRIRARQKHSLIGCHQSSVVSGQRLTYSQEVRLQSRIYRIRTAPGPGPFCRF